MNNQNRNSDKDYYLINDSLHTRHDMISQREQEPTLHQRIRSKEGVLFLLDLGICGLQKFKEFLG